MLPKRNRQFPDVPSAEEAGIGHVTVRAWAALVAPTKTPAPIITLINRELNAVLAKPEARDLLDRESIDPQATTPAELKSYIRSQLDVWGKAISDAGIVPD